MPLNDVTLDQQVVTGVSLYCRVPQVIPPPSILSNQSRFSRREGVIEGDPLRTDRGRKPRGVKETRCKTVKQRRATSRGAAVTCGGANKVSAILVKHYCFCHICHFRGVPLASILLTEMQGGLGWKNLQVDPSDGKNL